MNLIMWIFLKFHLKCCMHAFSCRLMPEFIHPHKAIKHFCFLHANKHKTMILHHCPLKPFLLYALVAWWPVVHIDAWAQPRIMFRHFSFTLYSFAFSILCGNGVLFPLFSLFNRTDHCTHTIHCDYFFWMRACAYVCVCLCVCENLSGKFIRTFASNCHSHYQNWP